MRRMTRITYGFLGGAMALALLAACPVRAQELDADQQDASTVSGVADTVSNKTDDALLDPNLYVGLQQAFQDHMKLKKPDVTPEDMKTLFFTLWQYKLLEEAKRLWVTRRPEDYELSKKDTQEHRVKGPRELSLGGILYKAADNWIVWLNGQRLTPDAIPKEVMDIKVGKDYIELKWYDSWTNLIFPIRLRPHQRFNLDSRIFLPGAPS